MSTGNSTLIVNGMACAACAARIEKRMRRLDGVDLCNVNLASGRAQIRFDAEKLNEETLCETINRMGFSAHAAQTGERAKQENPKRLLTEAILSAVLTLPMLLAMIPAFSFLHNGYLQWALCTPIQFYFGRRFLKGAWSALRGLSATMDTLVALGTLAAYLYSVDQVLFGHAHMFYFESSAMVITLVLLGRSLEGFARSRASDAIDSLMHLAPDTCVRVLPDGTQETVAIQEIAIDDLCLVRAGESVSVDGVVVSGEGSLDTSMLTGESLPVNVQKGSAVSGGTLCLNGAFTVQVTRIGADTALNRIIECTERAQGSKARVQQLADRIAGVFVPCVMAIALLTLAGTLLFTDLPFASALRRSISVLVVACPCALGLATPVAIIAGTGRGAKMGVLMRDGNALENLARVQTVLLDKTGTLTVGKPAVRSLSCDGISEEEFITLLKAAESLSAHPLARAVQALPGQEMEVADFENLAGHGVRVRLGSDILLCGNRSLMQENKLDTEAFRSREEEARSQGCTVLYLARNETVLGLCALADELKQDAPETIARLHGMHLKTVLITGDHEQAARHIASQAGIDEVYADTLPWDKADIVREVSASGRCVMVGDGINDAPAMESAYASVAMGNGSDIAIETADAMLVGGSLSLLPDALLLARKTLRIIHENLLWAFCYNLVAIPLAAFGILTPGLSGAAMAFSSIAVVTNALRLRAFRTAEEKKTAGK